MLLSFWFTPDLHAANANLKINATQPGVSGAVCVRAIIRKSDGSYVSGEWDSSSFPGEMRGKAVGPSTIIEVPTGETTITVGKGPDYFPQTITRNFDVPGQTYTVNVTLQPVFDLYRKGWRGGDAHVHYNHGENQISRTPQQAFTMLAAGGMNFAAFAEEHYGATTLTRQQMLDVWKQFDNSECKLWLGVEEPKNGWGHHIAILDDPWAVRSSMPYHLGIKTVHDQGGVVYPVHPQRLYPGRYYDDPNSGRQWFIYPDNNHLKSYPLDALLGYLDGWSGVSDQAHSEGLLDPYFQLLSLGYRIPLLADSDITMDRVNNGIKSPGCWMSYFQMEGNALSKTSIANAMKKGRVMSTTGPMLIFNIDNAEPGDTLNPNGSSRTVRIQASHTFNPWTLKTETFDGGDVCKISQIDLFRNGEVVQTWNPNSPTADVTYTINESSPNSYYMVRVLGNQNQWMGAYSSPIYFDASPRPRQPNPYSSLINGRLYDSVTGNGLSGSVACVRYGQTQWTIQTDSKGLFRAYVPLDAELVAKDSSGREFRRDIMKYEPAYAFCHYLSENFQGNMGASVDAFKGIVQEMTWEFPMGYQPAGSYVKTNLSGNATMSGFSVNSAPAPTSGKQGTEIVMLLVDKTRVQKGDTINFAVLFRNSQGQFPSEELAVDWRGWDPEYPRMYTRYGKTFQFNNQPAQVINLGGGFFVRQGSVVVPSWVANATETTAAIKLHAQVRGNSVSEEACLLLPLGPTKKELLVSTTFDGLPGTWGEIGLGTCNFHRELSALVRYSDYRNISVGLNLNGSQITIRPFTDTAHDADADDAIFTENFYYDGQCEPQFRNIPFRTNVRGQPSATDFSGVTIQDPDGTGGGGGGEKATLTVEINGKGTVSPNLNGKVLTVGRSYKLTAKPGADQIFSSWSGDVSSLNPTLTMTLQGDTRVQANFLTNPFAPVSGVYSGLFREPSEVRAASAGFFTLNVTKKGSFSGRFTIAGKKVSARGKFDATGNAPLSMKLGKTNFTGALELSLDVSPGQIVGHLGEGTWVSDLRGLQADQTATNNLSARYTVVFPGSDSAEIPAGDGFGTVSINRTRKLRFAGALADGTVISQSVAIPSTGEWPLFASVARGGTFLFGWQNLANEETETATWICAPQVSRKLYPAGFTNTLSVVASAYDLSLEPLMNLPAGSLNFSGGGIETLEVPIALSAANKFAVTGINSNAVSLKLTTASGIFSGQFANPESNRKTKFRGVIQQTQNSGGGYFLGTDQSGAVRVRASE